MCDIIDAMSEPDNALKLPRDESPPSFLVTSATDSETNTDFGLETNEADGLPLIRSPAEQSMVHRILRRLRRHHSDPLTEEDVEDGCQKSFGDNEDVKRDAQSKSSLSLTGIILASISCVFFATSSLIVKVSELHPMELLCVRGIVQAVLVSPIVISSQSSFLGPMGSRRLLLARATLGSVSLIMAFNSIHLIPLADASTVIFTSPVFVSIFACFCLGEMITWFDVSMITLTVLGVVLVAKPSFGLDTFGAAQVTATSWTHVVGIFCGVCAAMLTALGFIVLRQLKHVHYSVTVLWFSCVLAAFGAVLTVALDGFVVPCTWLAAVQCLGIGICGFLGQVLLTKALQLENAGPVAVARSLDIVLSFFYEITFLHDIPDRYSYIGSALVVACVVVTGLKRWYEEISMKYHDDQGSGTGRCRRDSVS